MIGVGELHLGPDLAEIIGGNGTFDGGDGSDVHEHRGLDAPVDGLHVRAFRASVCREYAVLIFSHVSEEPPSRSRGAVCSELYFRRQPGSPPSKPLIYPHDPLGRICAFRSVEWPGGILSVAESAASADRSVDLRWFCRRSHGLSGNFRDSRSALRTGVRI